METYQGWTNYETWNIKLWIDNDRSSIDYWHDRACNWKAISKKSSSFTAQENAIFDLRDELREYFETEVDTLLEKSNASASCFADLLNSALSIVNWYEIAKSLIEDLN